MIFFCPMLNVNCINSWQIIATSSFKMWKNMLNSLPRIFHYHISDQIEFGINLDEHLPYIWTFELNTKEYDDANCRIGQQIRNLQIIDIPREMGTNWNYGHSITRRSDWLWSTIVKRTYEQSKNWKCVAMTWRTGATSSLSPPCWNAEYSNVPLTLLTQCQSQFDNSSDLSVWGEKVVEMQYSFESGIMIDNCFARI